MGEVREGRADRTKRKLSMLAGFTAFWSQAMSPGMSGRPRRPYDVAHAMTFIRQQRRDPENGELAPRDLFWCRLSELLLTFLHVEARQPGQTMEELRRLLAARARPVDCPKCGGAGLKPLSTWKRYKHHRVGHETYHKRWWAPFEKLLNDCHRAMGEGLDAIHAALGG